MTSPFKTVHFQIVCKNNQDKACGSNFTKLVEMNSNIYIGL